LNIAVILLVSATAIFLLSNFALAQATVDPFGGKKTEIENNIGLSAEDPRIMVAKIINVAFGFLGIIAVGLIIYAGWLWMSSGGSPEKIDEAKNILKNAAIGLLIILSAWAIATFIFNKLLGGSSGGGGGGPDGGGGYGIAALGNGIVQSHYPARDAIEVPRNTKIVVTFREAITPSSIINASGKITDNIIVYPTAAGVTKKEVDIIANVSADHKTFVFKPVEYLGSPSEKIWYSVALKPGITREDNGKSAFGSFAGEIAYTWNFEVSTFLDLTPPNVESIIPMTSSLQPRNVVIQINFSEAVDPTSASGEASTTDNLIVSTGGAKIIGNFYITNQYKTVEFLTDDACGTNSCGNTIYCLPALKIINTFIRAASTTPIFPYNGVVDMADNSLDGNRNGVAQGPQAESNLPPYNLNQPQSSQGDDYTWTFSTTDKILISPPAINQIKPDYNAQGVNLNDIPEASFDRALMNSSLAQGETGSVQLFTKSNDLNFNYWLSNINSVSLDGTSSTTVRLMHDVFKENDSYAPNFKSEIKDIYQNCYKPCGGLNCAVNPGNPSCCQGTATAAESCTLPN